MFFNKATLALLVLGAVVIAGCVGGPPAAVTGYGLETTSATIDPATVLSKQTASISITVENQGEAEIPANEAYLELLGPTDTWGITPTTKTITRKLIAPAEGVVGGSFSHTWKGTAPPLPKGFSQTYTFYPRVAYNYSSDAVGLLWFYSPTESESARTAGRTLEQTTFTVKRGPLGVSIKSSPNPAVLDVGETALLMFTISNDGGGTVFNKTDTTGINQFWYKLSNTTATNKIDIITTECKDGSWTELPAGHSVTVSCEVNKTDSTAIVSVPVMFELEYGYYKDTTTSVTVTGR